MSTFEKAGSLHASFPSSIASIYISVSKKKLLIGAVQIEVALVIFTNRVTVLCKQMVEFKICSGNRVLVEMFW